MYDRIARYYDLSHDRLTADVQFMLERAAESGDPILELGCGSGRLLIPLARAGFAVTGVDNSAEMLARARVRLATEPPEVRDRIRLIDSDMTSLEVPQAGDRFGLLFFGYNTFMHLDETQAGRAMRQLRPWLRPGGQIVIDVDNPLALAAAADDPDFVLEEELHDAQTGESIRQYTAYEAVPGQQAVDVTWIYEAAASGRAQPSRVKAKLRYHYLYPHQIDLLLGLVGLRLQALYGDYDQSPFDEDSERLLVVAVADR